MVDIDADIGTLRGLHDALVAFRHAQGAVVDRAGREIAATQAALESRERAWQVRLDRCRAELQTCWFRAQHAAAEGYRWDCTPEAEAVRDAEEYLARIRQWRHRVEDEAARFGGVAGRFAEHLGTGLPRTEQHLTALIRGLQAARDVRPEPA